MTQKELADKIYVTPQAVSKWVKGDVDNIQKENIKAIGRVLGEDVATKLAISGIKEPNNMKQENISIKDLDTLEKAEAEAKSILDNSGIDKYPHFVYVMLEWLIGAIIGMYYHNYLNHRDRNPDDAFGYDGIFYYLHSFDEDLDTELKKEFYLLGMDLFESSGEFRLKNHDYAREAENKYEKFYSAYVRLIESEQSSNREVFHIALLDVIYQNSWY